MTRWKPRGRPALLAVRPLARGTLVTVLVAILVILLVLPIGAVVYGSFRSGSPTMLQTHWTLAHYRDFWPTVVGSGVLRDSLVLAACCTPLSLLIGGAFAFLAERTDLPARRLITPLMALGLAVFPTIRAMGWSMAADPDSGAITALARSLTGDKEFTVVDITGWGGVILLVTLAGSQICYFRLVGGFGRLGAELVEASRVAGGSRVGTLIRITVPLLWPVAGFVAVVSFLVDLQAFTEPYVLGSRPSFLMPAIVNTIVNASPPDYGPAGVLGVVTLAIALTLGGFQARSVSGREYTTVQTRTGSHGLVEIRRGRGLITAAITVFFFLTVVIPISSTVLASFTPYPGNYARFTLSAYQRVFDYTALLPAVRNSVLSALLGALVAVLISLAVAVVRLRVASRVTTNAIGILFLFALGLPGVVQALGMTWAYTTVPGLRLLYGTNALALLALVVITLPVLSQTFHGSLRQVSRDLEDAAVIAGSPRPLAFCRITIPLLLPSLLGGWFIGALLIFGNLEIPLLLGSPDNPLLMQLTYAMFSSGDRSGAAALATLFVAGIAVLGSGVLFLRRVLQRSAESPLVPTGVRRSLA